MYHKKNRMYFRCIQKTLSTANDEDIKKLFHGRSSREKQKERKSCFS